MSNQTKTNTSFLCIELLTSFSKKELQKFNQFIKSPYFNTDVKLIQLLELIEKEVLNKIFTRELQNKIYAEVFDEKLDKNSFEKEKKIFRTKLSKLNQLAHQFLVIERLNQNKNAFNDLLFSNLLDKKQFSAFQLFYKKDKKRLQLKERKETHDFEYLYKVEMYNLDYLYDSDRIYKKTDFQFEDILYKLNIQYLIKKLKLYITIYSDELIEKDNDTYNLSLKAIEYLLDIPNIKNNFNVKILCSVIDFLKLSNKKNYRNLLNLLEQNQNQMPLHELKTFYLIISNYFTFEIRKGNLEFEKDFTELYFHLDNQNLLLDDKTMPAIKLKNIVIRMCKSQLFNKAKYFVKKYIKYINTKDQENIRELCFAYINFYMNDYEKALYHIIKVENVNIIIEVNYRALIKKIYYENDQVYNEKTERYYRSAEKFYGDNKLLSTENKKKYKNFTQILINLYRFKHNEGRMTLEKLRAKLEQQDYNADKKWLLEKMDELKQ